MEKNIVNRQLEGVRSKAGYLFFKRLFDIAIALVGMIVLVIVTIILATFYSFGKIKGRIFFSQERIGLNGKTFKIYKYRSMVENAEEGRFIRKHSIDEIPQFINILKGDMSFIGPRPVIEEELLQYGERASKFLSVKPGATGWWQVSGRSEIGYPERCDMELYYVDNCSFKLDMKIFFLELKRIITKDAAY